MDVKIVVTGGAGFVGKHIVRRLLPDHEVVVIDVCRYSGQFESFRKEFPDVQLERGDLRDEEWTRSQVQSARPDALAHLAALHFIPECQDNPVLAEQTNVGASASVVAACREVPRLVVTSTGGTYAPSKRGHSEDSSQLVTDNYSLSKINMEQWVRRIRPFGEGDTVTVRLFNVIGSGETSPHLLPEVIRQLKKGVAQIRLGDLTTERDYIWAPDVAGAFEKFLTGATPSKSSHDCVNVGSGVSVRGEQLVESVFLAAGRTVPVVTDAKRLRASDRPVMCANITKAREDWGWGGMSVSLDEAVAQIWEDPRLAYVTPQ